MTRLVPVSAANPVPLSAPAPLASCGLGGLLHLLGREERRGGVAHVAVDGAGQAVHGPSAVPIAHVAAAAPVGGEVVVTGAGAAGHGPGPAVAGLAEDGTMRWSAAIPAPGPLLSWPVPVEHRGGALLGYATGAAGGPTRLHLASAGPEGCRQLLTVELEGGTDGLAAAASGAGVTILRAARAPDRVELLRLVGDRLEPGPHRPGPRAVAPSLVPLPSPPTAAAGPPAPDRRAEGAVLAAWIDPAARALVAQPFGPDLLPLAPADPLVTGSAGERPQSALLLAGGDGRLAITWRLATRDPHARAGTGHLVAGYDPAGGLVTPLPLADPGPYQGGAWAGEVLAVLHGSAGPLVSTFHAGGRAGG